MALTICPDCNGTVSGSPSPCPHCGTTGPGEPGQLAAVRGHLDEAHERKRIGTTGMAVSGGTGLVGLMMVAPGWMWLGIAVVILAVLLFGFALDASKRWAGLEKDFTQKIAEHEQQTAYRRKRLDLLQRKYNGDEATVMRILAGEYWQGMTADQLRDSLGNPDTESERVLKTKTKHVWTFKDYGETRRFTIENDVVTSWTVKESNY